MIGSPLLQFSAAPPADSSRLRYPRDGPPPRERGSWYRPQRPMFHVFVPYARGSVRWMLLGTTLAVPAAGWAQDRPFVFSMTTATEDGSPRLRADYEVGVGDHTFHAQAANGPEQRLGLQASAGRLTFVGHVDMASVGECVPGLPAGRTAGVAPLAESHRADRLARRRHAARSWRLRRPPWPRRRRSHYSHESGAGERRLPETVGDESRRDGSHHLGRLGASGHLLGGAWRGDDWRGPRGFLGCAGGGGRSASAGRPVGARRAGPRPVAVAGRRWTDVPSDADRSRERRRARPAADDDGGGYAIRTTFACRF